MTGLLLASACSLPSRERNQRAPIIAGISAAAIKTDANRDFDFRCGGSFLIDLFLDLWLIETILSESSFETEPDSASNHSRHSQSFKRRATNGVPLVEQVLRGDEHFDVPIERARDHHIDHREAA